MNSGGRKEPIRDYQQGRKGGNRTVEEAEEMGSRRGAVWAERDLGTSSRAER